MSVCCPDINASMAIKFTSAEAILNRSKQVIFLERENQSLGFLPFGQAGYL